MTLPTLQDLGFDEWFLERQPPPPTPDCRVARVTAVDRDRFVVRNEHAEVAGELTGKLRFSAESSMDFPAVGDWVLAQYYNDGTLAIIHARFSRRSVLRRKTPGKKIDYQLIASNIDLAFVVQSCDDNFNLRRLERYLVMIQDGHIEPAVVLSKSDLVSEADVQRNIADIKNSGIATRVIALSNETGAGLEEFRTVLERGKTYCLLGSSGVGKTTLLNRLTGADKFETKPVRAGDHKGKHTTTRRQLVVIDDGAMIIDTPGMRELGNVGATDGIEESFSDITEISSECRFANCSHTTEVGCAILAAIEDGRLNKDRYDSYRKLVKEAEYTKMSYVEKREKDRRLGRFYRSVLKDKKKER